MNFTVKPIDENHIQPVLTHKFKSHLEESSKVFFSGAYGMGKTTYLHNRFNNDTGDLKDEFIAFHLFPVNYVIADNKDIFELIKYDLLYQLLDYVDFEKLLENDSIYKNHVAEFISENYSELFFHFLTSFPQFGGYVEKIKSNLESLVQNFKDSKPKTKADKITSFIDEIELKKGSIYENDFYTKLIFGIIEEIKDLEKKEIVLVIDDLDRIDPNHIFRILNIFSAHIDCNNLAKGASNKFNIDKVVVVGDYNNIKSIFHHIYGVKTDFNGYIDKFYSTEVYKMSFEDKLSDVFFRKFNEKDEKLALFFINLVLTVLHDNNKFNLRQFHKIDNILTTNNNMFKDSVFEILLKIYSDDLSLLIDNLEESYNSLQPFVRHYQQYDEVYWKFILNKVVKSNLDFVKINLDQEIEINLQNKVVKFVTKGFNNFDYTLKDNDYNILEFKDFWFMIIQIFKANNFYSIYR
jgi:hypothetical protein